MRGVKRLRLRRFAARFRDIGCDNRLNHDDMSDLFQKRIFEMRAVQFFNGNDSLITATAADKGYSPRRNET